MYRIEHRFQDSGWMLIPGAEYENCGDAIMDAQQVAEEARPTMMTRVIQGGEVIDTFAAGTGERIKN